MFDDFLKELVKPSWWIGVVVVGFIINLASAYTKPLIDKWLGHYWLSSKQADERKQAQIDARAKELLTSPQLALELKLDVLTYTLRAVFTAAMAITCFLMIVLSQNESLAPILVFPFDPKSALATSNLLLLALGTFLLLDANVVFTKSFDKERVLRSYQKLRSETGSTEPS